MATTLERPEVVRDNFVVGLRNAHALEHQALALMDRQIDHLANYPDVERKLREHRRETEGQIERLETIMQQLDVSHSALKDAALGMTDNLAALAHTFASDEIVKNSFANFAFENFEAASYMGLIVIGQEGGFSNALPLLEQTLGEERAMARWVEQSLPGVIKTYLSLQGAGETASH